MKAYYLEMETKFNKGKVYKILNSIDNEIYVGSTIETLARRMAKHRSKAKTKHNYQLYQHMNAHGAGNFYIELIELYPCSCLEELRAKEGEWIRQIGTLNRQVAGRDKKGWYEDNKEQHLQNGNAYRENNKDAIHERQREHRQRNIDEIREYDRQRYKENPEKRKAVVKQWREHNKEYASEKSRRWREEHKEEKKAMDKQYREAHKAEIVCECGCVVQNFNLKKHMTTKKHKELMKQIQE